MKKNVLLPLWGGLFVLCAALGMIPEPEGGVSSLLTVLSVAFFVPPAILLYQAGKTSDVYTVTLIRNLSALSLALTAVVLILNFLCATGGAFMGNVLHYLLVIVSAPMICSGYWALSLFLWACLLTVSRKMLKQ